MGIMNIVNIILYAMPGLIFIIVVHELGHLILARLCGIKVEAFSLFFGRPIFKFNWKGIEWRLAWLPFGGYCKMKGHDDLGDFQIKKDPDEFYSRPPWARLLAILGGPLFNLLFAFLLFIILMNLKQTYYPNLGILVSPEYLNKEYPFQNGDEIIEVNAKKIESWGHLNEELLRSFLYQDQQNLKIKRGTEILTIQYTLDAKELVKQMKLGFMLPELLFVEEIPDKILLGENEESQPIYVLNPVQNYFQKGDLILAIDNSIVLSKYHLEYYLNKKKEDGSSERKVSFLSFESPIEKGAQFLKINGETFHFLSEIENQILDPDLKTYEIEYRLMNGEIKKATMIKKEIYVNPVQKEFYNEQTKKLDYKNILGLQLKMQASPDFILNQKDYYYNSFEVIHKAYEKLANTVLLSIFQFRLLFNMPFENLREGLSGPIGVVEVLGKAASYNWELYFNIIAILSVVLGIINLLPIPALDGGHVFLTLIEMIIRRPLNVKLVQIIQWVGVFIVISFALVVTFNDILKLISRF